MKIQTILGSVVALLFSLAAQAQTDWQKKVKDELPLMGHRNWIVVVDSAYPLQSSPGLETIETSADQLDVLDFVLEALKNSTHIRPIVHTDAELSYIPDTKAPGVDRYRKELETRLTGLPADALLHQKLIDQLNDLGKNYHVLILKTTMTIPYTSVFLQLDCRYWSAGDEAVLRAKMKAAK
jgi:hypothetical protein